MRTWYVTAALPRPVPEEWRGLLINDPEIYTVDVTNGTLSMLVKSEKSYEATSMVGNHLRELFNVDAHGASEMEALEICGAQKYGSTCFASPHSEGDHSNGLQKWRREEA